MPDYHGSIKQNLYLTHINDIIANLLNRVIKCDVIYIIFNLNLIQITSTIENVVPYYP